MAAAFSRQRRTGAGQVGFQRCDLIAMAGRDQVGVQQRDAVGGGVVLGGKEIRLRGDVDAQDPQLCAHLGLVEDRRSGARVGATGLPAAGTAVQRRLVRVVLGGAAVPAQHHQPAEAAGESHGGQCHLGEQCPLVQREIADTEFGRGGRCHQVTQPVPQLAVAAGVRVLAAASGAATQPAASASVKGAARASLAAWKADSAPAKPRIPASLRAAAASASGAGVSRTSWLGLDQHRAQIAGVAAEQVGEPDGDREEAGEAEGLVAVEGLEVPAQTFRAGVDAGDQLGVRRTSLRRGIHAGQRAE